MLSTRFIICFFCVQVFCAFCSDDGGVYRETKGSLMQRNVYGYLAKNSGKPCTEDELTAFCSKWSAHKDDDVYKAIVDLRIAGCNIAHNVALGTFTLCDGERHINTGCYKEKLWSLFDCQKMRQKTVRELMLVLSDGGYDAHESTVLALQTLKNFLDPQASACALGKNKIFSRRKKIWDAVVKTSELKDQHYYTRFVSAEESVTRDDMACIKDCWRFYKNFVLLNLHFNAEEVEKIKSYIAGYQGGVELYKVENFLKREGIWEQDAWLCINALVRTGSVPNLEYKAGKFFLSEGAPCRFEEQKGLCHDVLDIAGSLLCANDVIDLREILFALYKRQYCDVTLANVEELLDALSVCDLFAPYSPESRDLVHVWRGGGKGMVNVDELPHPIFTRFARLRQLEVGGLFTKLQGNNTQEIIAILKKNSVIEQSAQYSLESRELGANGDAGAHKGRAKKRASHKSPAEPKAKKPHVEENGAAGERKRAKKRASHESPAEPKAKKPRVGENGAAGGRKGRAKKRASHKSPAEPKAKKLRVEENDEAQEDAEDMEGFAEICVEDNVRRENVCSYLKSRENARVPEEELLKMFYQEQSTPHDLLEDVVLLIHAGCNISYQDQEYTWCSQEFATALGKGCGLKAFLDLSKQAGFKKHHLAYKTYCFYELGYRNIPLSTVALYSVIPAYLSVRDKKTLFNRLNTMLYFIWKEKRVRTCNDYRYLPSLSKVSKRDVDLVKNSLALYRSGEELLSYVQGYSEDDSYADRLLAYFYTHRGEALDEEELMENISVKTSRNHQRDFCRSIVMLRSKYKKNIVHDSDKRTFTLLEGERRPREGSWQKVLWGMLGKSREKHTLIGSFMRLSDAGWDPSWVETTDVFALYKMLYYIDVKYNEHFTHRKTLWALIKKECAEGKEMQSFEYYRSHNHVPKKMISTDIALVRRCWDIYHDKILNGSYTDCWSEGCFEASIFPEDYSDDYSDDHTPALRSYTAQLADYLQHNIGRVFSEEELKQNVPCATQSNFRRNLYRSIVSLRWKDKKNIVHDADKRTFGLLDGERIVLTGNWQRVLWDMLGKSRKKCTLLGSFMAISDVGWNPSWADATDIFDLYKICYGQDVQCNAHFTHRKTLWALIKREFDEGKEIQGFEYYRSHDHVSKQMTSTDIISVIRCWKLYHDKILTASDTDCWEEGFSLLQEDQRRRQDSCVYVAALSGYLQSHFGRACSEEELKENIPRITENNFRRNVFRAVGILREKHRKNIVHDNDQQTFTLLAGERPRLKENWCKVFWDMLGGRTRPRLAEAFMALSDDGWDPLWWDAEGIYELHKLCHGAEFDEEDENFRKRKRLWDKIKNEQTLVDCPLLDNQDMRPQDLCLVKRFWVLYHYKIFPKDNTPFSEDKISELREDGEEDASNGETTLVQEQAMSLGVYDPAQDQGLLFNSTGSTSSDFEYTYAHVLDQRLSIPSVSTQSVFPPQFAAVAEPNIGLELQFCFDQPTEEEERFSLFWEGVDSHAQ